MLTKLLILTTVVVALRSTSGETKLEKDDFKVVVERQQVGMAMGAGQEQGLFLHPHP
ncbi:hypothetical protein TIFTF001_020653 [Ficus carica]|uniref:Uncharacterized protein n=1 Tax=Ficus carica TaxID=3494 RepID=A0AA88AGG7_FICCA|nr:hypothetical protein TIFTF001_020653 [Ficus carica]